MKIKLSPWKLFIVFVIGFLLFYGIASIDAEEGLVSPEPFQSPMLFIQTDTVEFVIHQKARGGGWWAVCYTEGPRADLWAGISGMAFPAHSSGVQMLMFQGLVRELTSGPNMVRVVLDGSVVQYASAYQLDQIRRWGAGEFPVLKIKL